MAILYTNIPLNPVDVNKYTKFPLATLTSNKFIHASLSKVGEFECIQITRDPCNVLLDQRNLSKRKSDENTIILRYSEIYAETTLARKTFLAHKNAIRWQFYSNTGKREIGFTNMIMRQALRNLGSKLQWNKNDMITDDLAKVAGWMGGKKGNYHTEGIQMNFDVQEDIRDWFPADECNRPIGNIDVDINLLIPEYLKLMSKEMPIELRDMREVYVADVDNCFIVTDEDEREERKKAGKGRREQMLEKGRKANHVNTTTRL